MSGDLTGAKSFFHSIHVNCSDIWLESCINWCKSEVLNPGYTQQQLQSKLYEQWLLLDLRDVEIPCLPPNISSQIHFILNGNFCVQMMHVVDISKPKLWQLQRIRNSNLINKGTQQDSDIGGGKRVLQLTLTDGVQDVEAIEYKPISNLNINMAPGIKIRITGPVIVRQGKLLLEQKNVKVLGGEVEELLISCAAENVLSRALKLPENQNPVRVDEKLLLVEKEEEIKGYQRITEVKKSQSRGDTRTNIAQQANNFSPVVINEDEEIENLLLEAEQNESLAISNESKTPDIFEDEDFNPDDFDCLDQIATTSTQAVIRNNPTLTNKLPSATNINVPVNTVDETENQSRSAFIGKVLTIEEFLRKKDDVSRGLFKIKARFKSVVEKLTLDEKEYKMIIAIEDDTSCLSVRIHNDLISEFAGYTALAIQELKASILDENESAVEKVMTAIQKVKARLVALNGIVLLKVEKHELPTIIKIQ